MNMPINKKPLLSKFNLWYSQLMVVVFLFMGFLGLLLIVFLVKTTNLSLPASLSAEQAAAEAVAKRQEELAQLYKEFRDWDSNAKYQRQKQAAKQAYIDEISQEKEIILSGQTYHYYFQLLEASSTAKCGSSYLSGRLALMLNERVAAEHEFCGEKYPQIETYKLGEKFLIFLSHGVLDEGVDSDLLSNNQHVLIIIDDSGALQRQVIGYGEDDLHVGANDNEVIYHHHSFVPELYPEVLTKMKDLAACFADVNQCTREQIILAEGVRDGLRGYIQVIERLRINSNGQLFSVYQRVLAPETFCSLQNPNCVQALEKYIMDKQQCYQGNLACKSTDEICLQQRSLCLSHLNEEFLNKAWQWRDFTNVN